MIKHLLIREVFVFFRGGLAGPGWTAEGRTSSRIASDDKVMAKRLGDASLDKTQGA